MKASYKSGDETRTGSFDLVADEKHKHFDIWPTWKLSSVTSELDVTTGPHATGANIDGVTVGDGSLDVFPGVHLIKAIADESLFVPNRQAKNEGLPGTVASSTINADLNDATREAVQQAAIDSVKACAAEGSDQPSDCPGWPSVSSGSEVTWTWTSEPIATVTTAEDGSRPLSR